ncbi:acyl-CoA carboxylase subunit epsilon [Glaciihabitans sp. dw_435]|uniref:acyl-CoA carboxylase subunit epsilon n=1 Tax=Glaciihabitans sp. dw_435 TaxID=2720081 RepID=UPI001BD412A4|nr:acyl-CoA carboxylase subunit epsilon [Glaciihabitans sp. dw_435]
MAGKHAAPSVDDADATNGADVDAPSTVTGTPGDTNAPPEDPTAVESAIRVVSGNPTDIEIAAVTAVLSGVLEELAGELGRATPAGPSAWNKSQRDIRKPLVPGAGNWRGFAG